MPSQSHRVRLVAFDLDGTLLRGPTICESLAEPLGKLSRMREFEQLRDLTQIRAARQEMLTRYGEPLDALCEKLNDVAIAPGAGAWIGTGAQSGEIQHFWPGDKPVWLAHHADALGIELSEVAAVGDSHGDVPMLAAVGHPFFVGADLPPEIAHAVHAPNADLREIAQRILAR